MLHAGFIEVDLDTSEVWIDGKLQNPTIMGNDKVNGTRHRIEIWYGGRRRTIVLSRLIYLAATRQPIPQQHEIHHIDGNRKNDVWSNLICLSIADHQKMHNNSADVPF